MEYTLESIWSRRDRMKESIKIERNRDSIRIGVNRISISIVKIRIRLKK